MSVHVSGRIVIHLYFLPRTPVGVWHTLPYYLLVMDSETIMSCMLESKVIKTNRIILPSDRGSPKLL